MSLDLNTLLKDWPHETGAIKVRKIIGLDGREKLQLRIDLGMLQMEMTGRPDGHRPHNCESLARLSSTARRTVPKSAATPTNSPPSNATSCSRKAFSITIAT